jgi:periplasmic divalent cation tolerance protein
MISSIWGLDPYWSSLSPSANTRTLTVRPPVPAPPVRLVLTTCASPGEANRLGRTLVEERLAACATLIPAVESIYSWEGNIKSTAETLLLLKTGPDQLTALEARLHQLHSYQIPEFLVLGVEGVSHPYLEWLQANLRLT